MVAIRKMTGYDSTSKGRKVASPSDGRSQKVKKYAAKRAKAVEVARDANPKSPKNYVPSGKAPQGSLKGAPDNFGPKARSTPRKPTKTANTTSTINTGGDGAKRNKVRAAATKRKMSANLKKPATNLTAKAAAKGVGKGLLKVASRAAGPVGVGLLAADAYSAVKNENKKVAAMKKAGKKTPKGGGQMKRKK